MKFPPHIFLLEESNVDLIDIWLFHFMQVSYSGVILLISHSKGFVFMVHVYKGKLNADPMD